MFSVWFWLILRFYGLFCCCLLFCYFVLFSAWSNLVGEAEAGESKTSGLLPSVVSSVCLKTNQGNIFSEGAGTFLKTALNTPPRSNVLYYFVGEDLSIATNYQSLRLWIPRLKSKSFNPPNWPQKKPNKSSSWAPTKDVFAFDSEVPAFTFYTRMVRPIKQKGVWKQKIAPCTLHESLLRSIRLLGIERAGDIPRARCEHLCVCALS